VVRISRRRRWAYSAAAFIAFLLVDQFWGVQLGIQNAPGSGPDLTTPSPVSPKYTPFIIPTVPPWTPSPRYTGPGVLCRDGTISWSTGRGTCSHHGGER
jgi:hypothetical protein